MYLMSGATDRAGTGDERRGWLGPRAELVASLTAGALLAVWLIAAAAGWHAGAAAWASLAIGMVYGGRAAIEALREGAFDIDVLMVVAAGLAAAVGHPEDGALLLFLFVLAGALEARAMSRTMRAVEALHKLMPRVAMVWRGEGTKQEGLERGSGGWIEVDPQELKAGDRIWVRSGELVSADARVAVGRGSVDQSTLTGESLPREVGPGDEVYAGTLNLGQPVEAVVMRPAAESGLKKILDLVVSAQQQREPVQRMIDRLSQPYAIGVMAASVCVFLVWWGLLGRTITGADGALLTAIGFLIVGSPCALVIATPTATLAAISRGARAGLLFKGGHAIERLARMGSVCLDKTGTLTLGRARLQQVHAVAWSNGGLLLSVAAALEAGSTHPIATAVVEAAAARGAKAMPARGVADLPGKGLSGEVEGARARLGTYEHCEELIPVCLRARVRDVLERVRSRGQIGVVVAVEDREEKPENRDQVAQGPAESGGQTAVLILWDTLRPGARELAPRLHDLGVKPVRMLTGDNRISAAYMAGELGIDQWDAELLPQDKVRIVEEMKGGRRDGTEAQWHGARRGVGVIGDGVNDAPALAAADVSIAMGTIGSDAALESADIVVLSEDLWAVPWAVGLARRARGIITFNIALALSVIAGMGAAVLIGSLVGRGVPLWVAVLAHEGGTLLVVGNSLRLLGVSGSARGREPQAVVVEEPAPVSAAA